MRRRIALILTLAAWLLATGSHWDLVQAVGWGRMIVAYSRTMTLQQAVEKTFRGDDLCGVCQLVQNAKQADETAGTKAPGVKSPEKIFVASKPGVPVFDSPARQCAGVVPSVAALVSAERFAPPGPPPRPLA